VFVTGLTAMAMGASPAETVAVTVCARTNEGITAAKTIPPTARNDRARRKFPRQHRPIFICIGRKAQGSRNIVKDREDGFIIRPF
jgi:hypothetical protein